MAEYKGKQVQTKRYFYKDSEVDKTQAKAIKSLGGNIVTRRTDEWYWRNWQ
jgi:hypothetical protein